MSKKKLILTNINDSETFKRLLNSRKYSHLSKDIFLESVDYTLECLKEPSKKFLFVQEFEKEVRRLFYSKNIRSIVYQVEAWHPDVFAFLEQQYGDFDKFEFQTILLVSPDEKDAVIEMADDFDYLEIVVANK